MNEEKNMRLSQVARRLNVGTDTIASFLTKNGFVIDNNPNSKITVAQFQLLSAEFVSAGMDKKEAAHVTIGKTFVSLSAPVSGQGAMKVVSGNEKGEESLSHYGTIPILPGLKSVGKIDLGSKKVKNVVSPVATTSVHGIQEPASLELKEKLSPSESPPYTLGANLDQVFEQDGAKRNKITFSLSDDFERPTVVGKMNLPERTSRRHTHRDVAVDQVKPNVSVASSKRGGHLQYRCNRAPQESIWLMLLTLGL